MVYKALILPMLLYGAITHRCSCIENIREINFMPDFLTVLPSVIRMEESVPKRMIFDATTNVEDGQPYLNWNEEIEEVQLTSIRA